MLATHRPKLKIALLSWESRHSIAVGGLAEHVTELANALAQRGHSLHLFTRTAAGQSPHQKIDRVHYHRCTHAAHHDFVTEMDRMANAFADRVRRVEKESRQPFDIIHGHDWLIAAGLRNLSPDHPAIVATIHSTEFGRCGNQLHDGMSRLIRDREWEIAYIASRVITVSNALNREFRKLYNVPADKVVTIYNGVDVRRFNVSIDESAVRTRWAVGADDPLILFAGRLTWQKGPDCLIEAAPSVIRRHRPAKFLFAGDGDMRESLNARITARNMTQSIRMCGRLNEPDLVALFQTTDVVCVPSRNEPFGLVILEAWSARKPVVATRSGGPEELVSDGQTGLTVKSTSQGLSRGLNAILDDRENGSRMGMQGRKEAETRFTWDIAAAETEREYTRAITTRRA